MKPYGREKFVKGGPTYKKDYHIHEKNRKIENWWEDITELLSRASLKQKVNKEIENQLHS